MRTNHFVAIWNKKICWYFHTQFCTLCTKLLHRKGTCLLPIKENTSHWKMQRMAWPKWPSPPSRKSIVYHPICLQWPFLTKETQIVLLWSLVRSSHICCLLNWTHNLSQFAFFNALFKWRNLLNQRPECIKTFQIFWRLLGILTTTIKNTFKLWCHIHCSNYDNAKKLAQIPHWLLKSL